MIAFLNEYGYTIVTIEILMILWLIAIKKGEGTPTPVEQSNIEHSLKHRQSFLLNRTESKWGTD